MQGARASLDDLAVRWETPKGREVKKSVITDLKNNAGRGLIRILENFIYTSEVPNKADLRCITLESLDLNDATFDDADVSWASFRGSSLRSATFQRCNLKRATFEGCDLTLSRFKQGDCSRVDFSQTALEHANFQDARLTGSRFLQCDASRASFDGANLSKCNFVEARLEQTNFANANCSSANFSDGAFNHVAARPTKLDDVRFDMDLDEFEGDVGLRSMTFRTNRKFKGLDAILKMAAMLEAAAAAKARPQVARPAAPENDSGADPMLFGAPIRTQRLDPSKLDEGAGDASQSNLPPGVAVSYNQPPSAEDYAAAYGAASEGSYTPNYNPASTPDAGPVFGAPPGASQRSTVNLSRPAGRPNPVAPPAARGPVDVTGRFPRPPSQVIRRGPPTGTHPPAMRRPAGPPHAGPPQSGSPQSGSPQSGSPQPGPAHPGAPHGAPHHPGQLHGAPAQTASGYHPHGHPSGPQQSHPQHAHPQHAHPQHAHPQQSHPGARPGTARTPPPGQLQGTNAPNMGPPPQGHGPGGPRPGGPGSPQGGPPTGPSPGSSGILRGPLNPPSSNSQPGFAPSTGTRRLQRLPGNGIEPGGVAPPPHQGAASGLGSSPFGLAPPLPEAPEPTDDWATAIGQLMQSKGAITKIVIETGTTSRIIYRRP